MGPSSAGPPEAEEALKARVSALRTRIATACHTSGRDPDSVEILPATKGTDVHFIDALSALGFRVFGESRIGDFVRKLEARPEYVWDFIGRFRAEDAALLARSIRLIHSVATVEQAEALERACQARSQSARVLLQVNFAGDSRKQGWMEDAAVIAALEWEFRHLALGGLMVMGSASADPQQTFASFVRARTVFDRIRRTTGPEFAVLSMGMSDDFELGIRAGSTLVRIGTLLSGGADPSPSR